MNTHDFARKTLPLWRALLDCENLAMEIHITGAWHKLIDLANIARDTRAKFSAEEQEIVDNLLNDIKKRDLKREEA